MGVHGLTTYLRENQRVLSSTKNLSPKLETGVSISIVVDGWSFIYGLHRNSGLPWVYGGEYDRFSRLVSVVVRAWIKIGFRVYFVFDGACPELKFSTLVSRLGQSHIQPSLLFFRTSPASRGTSRFLNEARIIPPLSYAACLHALESMQGSTDALEIHFADEEGDPYAVELAGRVGGYVVGNDSDFIIMHTDGYLGYVPLDEMVWHTSEDNSHLQEEDTEFRAVRKPKSNKKLPNELVNGKGLIPPENDTRSLSFNIYTSESLATHLKIPLTLLPLLGALVGNDFSSSPDSSRRNVQSLFFERQLTLTQRILRVANTIQTILSPASQKRKKQKHQVDSVMDLIDRAVNALLVRSATTFGSGEIDGIVDKIVEATLQYALPKDDEDELGRGTLRDTHICALHKIKTCPLFRIVSRMVEATPKEEESDELSNRIALRDKYVDAYRKGRVSPKIMDILNSSSFWPRLFLESPDLETVGRSIGRSLRLWEYSILHDAVGLAFTEEEPDEEPSVGDYDDDDELVDVIESDSEDSSSGGDLLAPLKGELQRLHLSDEEGTEPPASVSSNAHPYHRSKQPLITEYIRRGTRVAEEAIPVIPLHELLATITSPFDPLSPIPLVSRSQEERMSVFLQALKSDLPHVRALPSAQLVVAISLRWVLQMTLSRAQETESRDRDKERWTRHEARCFLASFVWTEDSRAVSAAHEPPPIVDRNIQLMAQILMALESVEHLSQVLLLAETLPSVAHMLSGSMFHGYLTGNRPLNDGEIPEALWNSCIDGLEGVFGEERRSKHQKAAGKTRKAPSTASRYASGGLFQLLTDTEA